MNHYFMKLSARIDCDTCNERILVEVAAELDASEEVLYCLDDQITDAIQDQKIQDGWVSGHCPRCARNMAPLFAHLQDADDYCSNRNEEYL
jgi:hypothetical protein